jgi:hypothetical protein
MSRSSYKLRRSRPAAAAAALLALFLCGCQEMGYHRRGAELDLKGKILVVPLRDVGNYYYDSREGVVIADSAVRELLLNSRTLDPLPGDLAKGPVRSSMLGSVDWGEVGKSVGADYVVHGSLDELRWKDPADPMLPRCLFKVTYSVYSVAAKSEVYSCSKSGRYPFTLLSDRGVSVYEMGTDVFTEKSYEYIGSVIARTFYGYVTSAAEEESIQSMPHPVKR